MSTFDQRHIRRAFSRSAAGYDAAAALQHEVEKRLLESLDYFALRQGQDAADPKVVLDVGCGPAHAAAAMRKRWPKAQVVALDLALPMLREAKKQGLTIPLVGETTLIGAKVIELAGDAANGAMGHVGLTADADVPAIKEMVEKFKAKFGSRVGVRYILHPKPMQAEGDLVRLPLYMAHLL